MRESISFEYRRGPAQGWDAEASAARLAKDQGKPLRLFLSEIINKINLLRVIKLFLYRAGISYTHYIFYINKYPCCLTWIITKLLFIILKCIIQLFERPKQSKNFDLTR
ncbi:hypothetical protein PAEPH01_2003 [Pancytospora epiphaga]|nr:hypothetical protein PAEPH01_2003 [Pancytospora epiphaga]